jgi:phosphoglycolate phosphatase
MTRSTQLVIFDFDGTLFDTHESIAHTLALAFTKTLPPDTPIPTETEISHAISTGASLPATITLLYPGPPESGLSPSSDPIPVLTSTLLENYLKTYRSLYNLHGLPYIKPFPHVHELLKHLRSCSIPIAIVSNKGIAAVRAVLAQSELSSFVDVIIGDGEPAGAPRKPDPGSWSTILKPTFEKHASVQQGSSGGLEAQNVIVVGDTVADIQYAQNVGAKCVWCRYGYGVEEECMALRPDFVINGLEEVLKIVG